MTELHTATTNALPLSLMRDVRALLEKAFVGDFSKEDWDHATGGVHVWVTGDQGTSGR